MYFYSFEWAPFCPLPVETVLSRDPKPLSSLEVIFIWQFLTYLCLKIMSDQSHFKILSSKTFTEIALKVWFKLTSERKLQVKVVIPRHSASSGEIFEFYKRVPGKPIIKWPFVYRTYSIFLLAFPFKYSDISYLWISQMLTIFKTSAM